MKVFLSYTRGADLLNKVSALRDRIEAELAIRSPGSRVFQDKKHLHEGDHFPEMLAHELNTSDVFLVLVSPAWLVSEWCRREYSLFTEDGANAARLHRILPVLWVPTPQLVGSSPDPIARALAAINYSNWSKLRYRDWDDPANQEQIGNLAERALTLGSQVAMPETDTVVRSAFGIPHTSEALNAPVNDGVQTPISDHAVLSEKPDKAALTVQFELNTRDHLRRVLFGLEKHTRDDNVEWIIDFLLFERKRSSDDYGQPLVRLHVRVAHSLNAKAELAAKGGLTASQAKHVLGPAANDAKATTTGTLDENEASKTIQATLKK